jgi:hypothetical protein
MGPAENEKFIIIIRNHILPSARHTSIRRRVSAGLQEHTFFPYVIYRLLRAASQSSCVAPQGLCAGVQIIPFLYSVLQSCQLKIIYPSLEITPKTLLTILITPAIVTAGQFLYLIFHLIDTVRVDVILAFAIATTKCTGQVFDVAYVSYFCLLLIHF